MSSINLNVKHVQRNDTRENWLLHNPILLKGELGIETDTMQFKVGNGVDVYTSLPYFNGGSNGIKKATTKKVTAITDGQKSFEIPFSDFDMENCYLDIRVNSVWINPEKYRIEEGSLVFNQGKKLGTEVFLTCHYFSSGSTVGSKLYSAVSDEEKMSLIERIEKLENDNKKLYKMIEKLINQKQ